MFAICISSLEKCLSGPLPIFKLLLLFFCCWVVLVLYIMDISTLSAVSFDFKRNMPCAMLNGGVSNVILHGNQRKLTFEGKRYYKLDTKCLRNKDGDCSWEWGSVRSSPRMWPLSCVLKESWSLQEEKNWKRLFLIEKNMEDVKREIQESVHGGKRTTRWGMWTVLHKNPFWEKERARWPICVCLHVPPP